MTDARSRYARIYRVVKRVPKGTVATYGQIAELAGLPGHARQVGYALHAMRDQDPVPWQRVVNAKGEISPRAEPGMDEIQRQLLEQEGIDFDERGRISLRRFRWSGGRAKKGAAKRPKKRASKQVGRTNRG